MTITSVAFFLFFLIVLLLLFLLKSKARKYLLLGASFIFIGSLNILSLAAVLVFSLLNFMGGKIIARNKSKATFLFFIVANILAILINNFILQQAGLFSTLLSDPRYLLNAFVAIGISFYSLSHIAYITDVWKGRLTPENSFLNFLLFSAYFPKMLAGPVTLYQQFSIGENKPTAADLHSGIGRIFLGLLKKIVLADRLAPCVAALFDNNMEGMPGVNVLLAGFLFTLQLYFDFSGYTDIVLGCSRMLGIILPENFSMPLRSASVTMFWRRWHQSLLHFFSAYIFYPVSFYLRRRGKLAVCVAIVVTFGISALWHGVSVTFLLWGCCHIVFLLVEYLAGSKAEEKQSGKRGIKIVYVVTTLVLVSFSNIFFRAESGTEVSRLFGNLVNQHFFPVSWFREVVAIAAQGGHQQNIFNLLITLVLAVVFLFMERRLNSIYLQERPNWLLFVLTIIIILVFGALGNTSQFIYAQFT